MPKLDLYILLLGLRTTILVLLSQTFSYFHNILVR